MTHTLFKKADVMPVFPWMIWSMLCLYLWQLFILVCR